MLLSLSSCGSPEDPEPVEANLLTELTTQTAVAQACDDINISQNFTTDDIVVNRMVYSEEFTLFPFLPFEITNNRARETYVYSFSVHDNDFENSVLRTTSTPMLCTIIGQETTLTPTATNIEILTGNVVQNRIVNSVTNYGQTDTTFYSDIYIDLIDNVSCISPDYLTSRLPVTLKEHTLKIESEDDFGYYFPIIRSQSSKIVFLSLRVVTETYVETKDNQEKWEVFSDYENTLIMILGEFDPSNTFSDLLEGPYETQDDFHDTYCGIEIQK